MVLTILQCGNIVTTAQFVQDRWYAAGCPNKFWSDFYSRVAIKVRKSDRWIVYDADSCVGYGFRYEYDAMLFMRFWSNQGDFSLFNVSELV